MREDSSLTRSHVINSWTTRYLVASAEICGMCVKHGQICAKCLQLWTEASVTPFGCNFWTFVAQLLANDEIQLNMLLCAHRAVIRPSHESPCSRSHGNDLC